MSQQETAAAPMSAPMPEPVPYGAWPSPISAEDVARAGEWLDFVAARDGTVWWSQLRPAEGGRLVVLRRDPDGSTREVVPAGWNARTRVHEYGGLAWLPVEDALVTSAWEDQRLYRLAPGAEPAPLTPEPEVPAGWRYAEPVLSPDGTEAWCVRETHAAGKPVRHDIVAVPLDGSAAADPGAVRVLAGGSDFLAHPRPSPDGRHLAWVAWDHPRMPWDGSELRVAEVRADGSTGEPRTLLGGPEESAFQPEWAGEDALYAVSDRSGWWNLYRVGLEGGEPVALCPREEEFGAPMWELGYATYAVLPDGRLAVLHGTDDIALGLLDPATGFLADLDLPYTSWQPTLRADGATVVGVAASPTRAASVVSVDTGTGHATEVHAALPTSPDPAYLPVPRAETLPGPDGREVHAWVYPPRNGDVRAPGGERPPYVVFVHGGPTAQVHSGLDVEKAFFTSRGIGVVDVNYGGSTGYGRGYRERLRRQWGVVDVQDCIAAARALVDRGEADGDRIAIRGGSAGGWTTLAALTGSDFFAAGTSYYGGAELLRFAEDTHDFESRYLDGLVGELPADREVYRERAPLSHVDGLSCPVLLLQGLEDEVVPPSQAEMFRDALAAKGLPHAYLTFAGEQHGFRKAESTVTALQAELSFYGQVFGFDPPGVPRLDLAGGLPPR